MKRQWRFFAMGASLSQSKTHAMHSASGIRIKRLGAHWFALFV